MTKVTQTVQADSSMEYVDDLKALALLNKI